MIVLATCARTGRRAWTISTGTPACALPRTWASCASRMWMSVDSDPVCVRMVPLAPTPSVASRASASMAGQALTVVSILMTAQVLLASMVPLALIGWAASTAGAHQERQDYCAIWMMPAHQTHAMLMRSVTQAPSMALTLAPVQVVTRGWTAVRT